MASNLPDYVASAKPVPMANRIAWYKSTAQTYAGIMLWFVFWKSVPMGDGTPGGTLTQGLWPAFVGLVAAAFFCHVFYYLAPGLLGLRTGLPLYIVGTSTYGVTGGFIMPGFLMGLLQFGWLGVNAFAAAQLLCAPFYNNNPEATVGTVPHMVVSAVWAIAAAFMGLKGIKYVARVATYFPVIPLAILVILVVVSFSGIQDFVPAKMTDAAVKAAQAEAAKTAVDGIAGPVRAPLAGEWAVIATLLTAIIGFFATAGAAGADFGMNNRSGNDVQLGGLVGIAGATILAGGLSLLIVAGANGLGKGVGITDPTALMPHLLNETTGRVFMYLLAIASFPPACFSSFIAANSFKTTLPKINPFLSVGVGTLVSIALAASGAAGNVVDVFTVIGASFGPICGAMTADYLLSGCKWAGPRAGFNPAGWISWAVGFLVGAAGLLAKYIPQLATYKEYIEYIPVPPLSAMIVGFVLYAVLALIGLKTRTLDMPETAGPA
jgi:cytosine permease